MNILFLGADYLGHLTPCGELIKALVSAGHSVTHTKYRHKDSSPADFNVWLLRSQNKIDEQLELYEPLVASNKFDLLISELPIFAAARLKEKYKIPWIVFNALPLFCQIKDADLFLQASIPEFERWKTYPNLRYVGFFVEKPTIHFEKDAKLRPVIHVTQGTLANQDGFLIQTTKEALDSDSKTHQNDYLLVSEPVPHKIWMPFFDVFITNGGFGGVSLAVYHGTPIICAGETEDKPLVGEKIENAGLGVNLRTAKPTKMQIRMAVERCLTDLRIQENCKKFSGLAKSYKYQKAINLIEQTAQNKLSKTA